MGKFPSQEVVLTLQPGREAAVGVGGLQGLPGVGRWNSQ